jgi:hypothetical protein
LRANVLASPTAKSALVEGHKAHIALAETKIAEIDRLTALQSPSGEWQSRASHGHRQRTKIRRAGGR